MSTYLPDLKTGIETEPRWRNPSGEQSGNKDAAVAIADARLSSWVAMLLKNLRQCGFWIAQRVKTQRAGKRLRVSESVSLGERRFVAVIQVDQERFLIGGSSTAVCLLTRLRDSASFAEVLRRSAPEDGLK